MSTPPQANTQYNKMKIDALHELGNNLHISERFSDASELVIAQFVKGLRKYPARVYKTFPLLNKKCPFCYSKTDISEKCIFLDDDYVETTGALEYCHKCRYWRWHYIDTEFVDRGGVYVHQYTSLVSIARDFSTEFPDEVSSDLAQWLRRNSMRWHTITPTQLEKLVADIFRANYSESNVIHVGRPDDGGVDVIFIENEDKQWLIQVKRREKPEASESVSTIRNLLGTMLLEGSSYGIVVSTADHFTYRSFQAVGRARECGMTIRLIDRKAIDQMLDPVLPTNPWLEPVLKESNELQRLFTDKIEMALQLRLL